MDDQVLQLVTRITLTVALIGILSVIISQWVVLMWRTERLRAKLREQGIRGPPPSLLLGNLREMRRSSNKPQCREEVVDGQVENAGRSCAITHGCSSKLFPFFDRWRKKYGKVSSRQSINDIISLCNALSFQASNQMS